MDASLHVLGCHYFNKLFYILYEHSKLLMQSMRTKKKEILTQWEYKGEKKRNSLERWSVTWYANVKQKLNHYSGWVWLKSLLNYR